MTPTRRTAVIVVNYGSSHLLERNLGTLRSSHAVGEITVVVVDNRSTEPERRAVADMAHDEGWILVESTNVGFGAGVNRGAEVAERWGADHLLLLNPDAWIGESALADLIRRSAERPRALFAPVVERPDGSIWFRGATLDLERGRTLSRPPADGSPDERLWLSAACLMISMEAWQLLGGFDEDYFLYWEDVDLSVCAAKAGLALEVCTDLMAVHDQGGTQQGSRHTRLSWDYYRYNIRNRLVFGAKHLDDRHWRSWVLSTPQESYRILLRGAGRRIFLSPFRPLRTAVGAVVEGLRAARAIRATRSS